MKVDAKLVEILQTNQYYVKRPLKKVNPIYLT